MREDLQPAGDELLMLLREQAGLYKQLRAMCATQRTQIETDCHEGVLEVLRDRNGIMRALSRVNDQLRPYRDNWPGTFAGLTEAERSEAAQLIEAAGTAVEAVIASDRDDSARLAARKQAVAREIRDLSGARSASAAYAQIPSSPAAISADLTG